jgi:hypothetical protein
MLTSKSHSNKEEHTHQQTALALPTSSIVVPTTLQTSETTFGRVSANTKYHVAVASSPCGTGATWVQPEAACCRFDTISSAASGRMLQWHCVNQGLPGGRHWLHIQYVNRGRSMCMQAQLCCWTQQSSTQEVTQLAAGSTHTTLTAYTAPAIG